MITINLLPDHLRPVKRTPLPYILGVLFLAAALLGIAFAYLQNQSDINYAQATLDRNEQELQDLAPIVEKSNALVAEKKELAVKLETIQEISNDRIVWSRQLHNLNRLAPANLWYEGISTENKPFKERVPYTDPRTGQTKEKVVRIDRPVLKLEGYVISVNGETPTISPLTLATEEDEEFSNRFQLLTTAFADTTFEGFPVRSFTLEYNIEFQRPIAELAAVPVEPAVEEGAPLTSEPGNEPDAAAETNDGTDETSQADTQAQPEVETPVPMDEGASPAPEPAPAPADESAAPAEGMQS